MGATKAKAKWYIIDGVPYTLHVAFQDDAHTDWVPIIADSETWPSVVAGRERVDYVFMRNANDAEAAQIIEMLDLNVEKIVEV